MTFKEILANFTGFSSPIFGLQWEAPVLEVTVARDVVNDLEDRRVLFRPAELEDHHHSVKSVNIIRERLTDALKRVERGKPLDKQLRKMRTAAQRFVDSVGYPQFDNFDRVVQTSILERELFKLRETVGKALGEIVVAHGLDVDDQLAAIIPFNNAQF